MGKGTKPALDPDELSRALVKDLQGALWSAHDSTTQAAREVRRKFSRLLHNASGPIVLRIAEQLLMVPGIPKFVAYELLSHHKAALGSLTKRDLQRLGHGLDSWGEADAFACYVAGPVWRQGQINNKDVLAWANSKDVWWRRIALVSTVPLNNKTRGGDGDPQRTLLICGVLLQDREDMVVKALSWALRELAKREPAAVDRFLEAAGEAVASRVRREVRNKLATGLKNPKRGTDSQ